MSMKVATHRGWEKTLDPLELKLQAVVSYLM